ncbi:MAG: S-adenosylmethionine:tRNA ribosyltransferase-isomerase [Acidimicrobiales bacterium]|nr:S-adenosylmethionine:tRNA ribosyltransferase-isomerase [Acidimicrobiales bacterium]
MAPARLAFDLPPTLEAHEPPEARRLSRDGVRMMVASRSTGALVHSRFRDLPDFLHAGDLVVVNTSGVLAAAVNGVTASGERIVVHFSTQLFDTHWVVEFRRIDGGATERWGAGDAPECVALGEGAGLTVVGPYRGSTRLYVASLSVPSTVISNAYRDSATSTVRSNAYRDSGHAWLEAHGRPIRYRYVERPWPIAMYQNVYATEPGSAEMPSAGRPFTPQLITRLVAQGVMVAPIVLHTGVASLEADELPYPEYARVPASTAALVNLTRDNGGRVIAVGTTVVRALESAGDTYGRVEGYDGWTELVITPERGVHHVDGLITGWHEPEASHLLMLEAIAGRALLERSYDASLAEGYLWHEFGDTHLILP